MTDKDEVLRKEIKDWQGVYNLLMSPNYDLVFMPNKKMAEDLAKDMFRIFAQQRNKVLDEVEKWINGHTWNHKGESICQPRDVLSKIAELKKGVVK